MKNVKIGEENMKLIEIDEVMLSPNQNIIYIKEMGDFLEEYARSPLLYCRHEQTLYSLWKDSTFACSRIKITDEHLEQTNESK